MFCGMFRVTLFGLFLTLAFFYVIRRLDERRGGDPGAPS